MRFNLIREIAGLAVGLVLGAVASAPSLAINFNQPAFAAVAGTTSIPIGAADFCRAHPAECRPAGAAVDAVVLTEANWRELLAVNARFNSEIVPVTDQKLYQVAEFWTYPRGYGDCEDIVLAKRRQLIAQGWAPSTLLITVVRQANGEGHAVLMVRSDRGDLVLDNQEGLVKLWNETAYAFIKRQSQWNPGEWVDIIDDRTPARVATR